MWCDASVLSPPRREKKQKIQDIRKNVKDAIVVSFILHHLPNVLSVSVDTPNPPAIPFY